MGLETYLRIKSAGSVGDFIENNISRPIYDTFGGTGAYNKAKFVNTVNADRNNPRVDYAKTNPNISRELAERANNYRNTYQRVDNVDGSYNVPAGSEKYIPANFRRSITENVKGSVIPKTNAGSEIVKQRDRDYYYNDKPIRLPRRMQNRKKSMETYYNERKAKLNDIQQQANGYYNALKQNRHNRYDLGVAIAKYDADRMNKVVPKLMAKLDAEFTRDQQMKQQQAQQRQQRAQQQREQYRAQKRQAMQQQLQ